MLPADWLSLPTGGFKGRDVKYSGRRDGLTPGYAGPRRIRAKPLFTQEVWKCVGIDSWTVSREPDVFAAGGLAAARLFREVLDQRLGAPDLEARPVEEQLDGALDADPIEERAQLIAHVKRVRAGQDPRVDVERRDLRGARKRKPYTTAEAGGDASASRVRRTK